ncbi:anti-sigma factor [Lysobacter sp. TAF61]|uniref:anti-sigma factor family protein n=1 Tax=Lysobacter sp. TAF61 TaxID=3233072 RepID=UPI003F94ED28
MTILRFEGSAHNEADRLLPWYVNGTLDEGEHARVERHLGQCPQCQREVELLRGLAASRAAEHASPDPTAAFLRLRQRLQAPHSRPARSMAARTRQAWSGLSAWLRPAVAVPCALALAMLGIVAYRADLPAPAMYRTLGDTPAPGIADAGLRHLVVVFDPHIEHARMQQLLRASQARIVDGPNEAGAYVLAVPASREPEVRAALRAADGVTLVESLEPVERR